MITLPCGHYRPEGTDLNCQSGKFTEPEQGAVGVCVVCEAWWELDGGRWLPYSPTAGEEAAAAPSLRLLRLVRRILKARKSAREN